MLELWPIRAEQFEALDCESRKRFHREVVGVARRNWPAATEGVPDAKLLDQVAAAHDRANDRGITGRADVAKFALLDVCLGPGFDRQKAVDVYLRRTDLTHQEKLDDLYERLSHRLRSE